MSAAVCLHVCVCVTIRLVWRTAAAESHDDGGEREASLHAVLPDALQDVEREVDVQITQEHDAVTILQEQTHTRIYTYITYLKKQKKQSLNLSRVWVKSVWMFRLRSLCMSRSRFVRTPADVHTRLIWGFKD